METGTLTELREALDGVAAVDFEALADDELHAVVVELGELSTRLEAQWCRAIARWDARMVWADNGSRSPAARLLRADRPPARAAVGGLSPGPASWRRCR